MRLSALLALPALRRVVPVAAVLLAFLACDMADPGGTTVQGTIRNTTGQPVAGAVVDFDGTLTTTASNGTYSVSVSNREYALRITAPGYTAYTETIEIDGDRTVDRELHGPNQVNGQVVNSQDGLGLAGAAISFSRNGVVELVETTDVTGFFNITDAPDGTFDLSITRTGFVEYRQTGVNITGGSFSLDPIALAETPAQGTVRIVVTWGDSPSDLDAHLTGPDGAGNRFHLYYSNRNTGGATLDHDDTSSNGPETVTIAMPHDGTYRYSIHNYSNQSESGAAEIAASPTRVQVYGDAGLVRSYTAPAGGQGNTWRVFELVSSGGTATLSDNGGASLGYFTASGSSDTGVFLTGGGGPPAPSKRPAL
jgi:hypothetical protein